MSASSSATAGPDSGCARDAKRATGRLSGSRTAPAPRPARAARGDAARCERSRRRRPMMKATTRTRARYPIGAPMFVSQPSNGLVGEVLAGPAPGSGRRIPPASPESPGDGDVWPVPPGPGLDDPAGPPPPGAGDAGEPVASGPAVGAAVGPGVTAVGAGVAVGPGG
jgi:hypothetical protein